MILLLDQGNTRLKWLLVSRDGVVESAGYSSNRASLLRVCEEIQSSSPVLPAEVVACNVAGSHRQAYLADVFSASFGTKVRFLTHDDVDCGALRSGYLQPNTLGMDRWLAMLAARRACDRTLLVVSVGTAMTVDAVHCSGQHLGGYIAPGVRAQVASLSRAAGLPSFDWLKEDAVAKGWGVNTRGAIWLGVTRSLAALVEKSVGQLEREVGERPTVVLTGGDSKVVANQLVVPYSVVDDLVFRGLWTAISGGAAQLSFRTVEA